MAKTTNLRFLLMAASRFNLHNEVMGQTGDGFPRGIDGSAMNTDLIGTVRRFHMGVAIGHHQGIGSLIGSDGLGKIGVQWGVDYLLALGGDHNIKPLGGLVPLFVDKDTQNRK